jgi:hypothetical protein
VLATVYKEDSEKLKKQWKKEEMEKKGIAYQK